MMYFWTFPIPSYFRLRLPSKQDIAPLLVQFQPIVYDAHPTSNQHQLCFPGFQLQSVFCWFVGDSLLICFIPYLAWLPLYVIQGHTSVDKCQAFTCRQLQRTWRTDITIASRGRCTGYNGAAHQVLLIIIVTPISDMWETLWHQKHAVYHQLTTNTV